MVETLDPRSEVSARLKFDVYKFTPPRSSRAAEMRQRFRTMPSLAPR